MRVVTTGGRSYKDKERVWRALDRLRELHGARLAICHGHEPYGCDDLVDQWCVKHGVAVFRSPAHWTAHGLPAGPIRNVAMLEHFRPELVLAFPGGAGTAHCVRSARALNIPVEEIR